ncbi:hypothetical protein [Thalassotalea mangrovi]|uniref:hypothetical protein n=1 Tax=Thalassotalea mangrovi TaxID=2572245 RepID=UPI001B804DD7|nr:hypothetical protein [Thalassotalea mangrovi]
MSQKSENQKWLEVDVSSLEVGQIIEVNNSYFVMKQATGGNYIIFRSFSPYRGCELEYIPADEANQKRNIRKEYENQAHFYEPECDGGVWLPDGMYAKGTGHPFDTDLLPQKYKISRSGFILIDRS